MVKTAQGRSSVRSLDFDLNKLVTKKEIVLDHAPHQAPRDRGDDPDQELPLPLRRFIGDMSQTERIILGLDLRKTPEANNPLA